MIFINPTYAQLSVPVAKDVSLDDISKMQEDNFNKMFEEECRKLQPTPISREQTEKDIQNYMMLLQPVNISEQTEKKYTRQDLYNTAGEVLRIVQTQRVL